MKKLIILFFLLIYSFSHSQDNDAYPNNVEKRVAYFYKESWKPFTGNLLLEEETPKLITKIKIKDGFEILAELYQNNKLVQILKNGREAELNEQTKTEFSQIEKFTDTVNLKHVYVLMSYNENPKTKEKIKFNGIVKFESTKLYYENGVRVKIELFYDENFEKIKASYELFHTELGNIEFDEEIQGYDGDYKMWNENGSITESGKYKFGKKVI
jgi:antitoxin component YwqK of YwqJK toxin-antitoxin module